MTHSDNVHVVQTVKQLQEQRAYTYFRMERLFKQIQRPQDINTYEKICAQITATFKAISEQINQVNATVPSHTHLYKLIRRLQQLEQYKLEQTVEYQLLMIHHILNPTSSCTSDGSHHQCNHQHEHSKSVEEPLDIFELDHAKLQSRRALASVVSKINEVMDELLMELCD